MHPPPDRRSPPTQILTKTDVDFNKVVLAIATNILTQLGLFIAAILWLAITRSVIQRLRISSTQHSVVRRLSSVIYT